MEKWVQNTHLDLRDFCETKKFSKILMLVFLIVHKRSSLENLKSIHGGLLIFCIHYLEIDLTMLFPQSHLCLRVAESHMHSKLKEVIMLVSAALCHFFNIFSYACKCCSMLFLYQYILTSARVKVYISIQ